MFLSLSKAATSFALNISEGLLLLFGVLLVVGLIGEYAKSDRWKKRERMFMMFVIVGVAGELVADGGIFTLSAHLQTLSDLEVARLNEKAESANATAKNFESQIADANAKAEIARRDAESFRLAIANAQGSASHAEAEALGLKKKMADRVCGPAEIAALATELKRFGGQTFLITTYPNMEEPLGVANCILRGLSSAQWTYTPLQGGSILIAGIGGVLVHVSPKAGTRTTEAATGLAAELEGRPRQRGLYVDFESQSFLSNASACKGLRDTNSSRRKKYCVVLILRARRVHSVKHPVRAGLVEAVEDEALPTNHPRRVPNKN